MTSETEHQYVGENDPTHLDHPLIDSEGRQDYDSTLVSPASYIIKCPRCRSEFETRDTRGIRCPTCRKAIGVVL